MTEVNRPAIALLVICTFAVAVLLTMLLARPIAVDPVRASPETTSTPLYPPGPEVVSESRFFDGTWKVGEEIAPGHYLAVIPEEGINYTYDCYWARLRGESGKAKNVISNQWRIFPGEVTVTIKKSDKYFQSSGCGTWNKVAR